MAEGRYGGALRYVHTLFTVGAVGGLTDGELLERFTAGPGEVAELAFTALVERHGPMVLRVCRSVLREPHDAQDAFQAAFMVLARKASSIRSRDSMASWLYGVAYRVSACARAAAARRRRHEKRAAEQAAQAVNEHEFDEFGPRLHEELNRLPEKFRAPVVLCYLEGLTHDQAAQQLRLPVGTVHSRLTRARELLRQRLTRRGIAANEATFTAALATESLPASLLDSTVKASLSFIHQPATAAALASATALARGALHAMTISKLKILGTAALACMITLGGASTFAYQFGGMGGMGGGQRSRAAAQTDERQAALIRSVDKIQADLVESASRNAALQKELQDLRAELEALRGGQDAAVSKAASAKKASGKTSEDQGQPAHGSMSGGMATSAGSMSGGMGMGMGMGGMARGGGFGGGMGSGFGGGMASGASFGGMGGRMGGLRNAKGEPHHMWVGNLILMSTPSGEKVTLYNLETGQAKSIRLSTSKDTTLDVAPLYGGAIGALSVSGPNVTRIAVFTTDDGTWYPEDLREPVDGFAAPVVGSQLVSYTVGHFIYAFSSQAKRWDVLELPKGTEPTPTINDAAVTFDHDGHLYVFSAGTGKWKDIDTRALLNNDEEEGTPKK
ncbi:MAG TPA: RNA polymerase sigma factor [Isosphaeraceae bacterium]|nr:RNA polymerase sigma factor [Isosphaeraceae bacterium]